MPWFLGIDTSNYTTSIAGWNSDTDQIIQQKKPLPVKQGELGLRQSDAVFSHTNNAGILMKNILGHIGEVVAVGASVRPRDFKDSYMPCFLVGKLLSDAVSASLRVPQFEYSHQAGHIVAALYSVKQLSLVGKEFIAFHLSGGTTECVYVSQGEDLPFQTKLLYQSSDLFAGQAVDRVGGMLGLGFPAGPALEQLALLSKKHFKVKIPFRDGNPSLSGLENQCKKMLSIGEEPEDIARYCLEWISAMVQQMTATVKERFPNLPVIYAGGVMSNSIIQEEVVAKYGGYFAEPIFSSDNAAGIAVLTGLQYKDEKE